MPDLRRLLNLVVKWVHQARAKVSGLAMRHYLDGGRVSPRHLNLNRPMPRISADFWDMQYRSGVWKVLHQLDEQAHYAVLASFLKHINPNGAVLDVGCGEGLFFRHISGYPISSYIGVDLSRTAIEIFSELRSPIITSLTVGDAETYVPETLVDVIVFCESLYYFADAVQTVKRYSKFLRPNGFMLISIHRTPRVEQMMRQIRSAFRLMQETDITNQHAKWTCAIISNFNETGEPAS